jgi:hypothetical protein
MSTTQTETPGNDGWQPCPPGGLADLGARLRTVERSKRVLRGAGVATLGLAVVVGIAFTLGGPGSNAPSISCPTAIARFEAYHAHLTGGDPMAANEAQQMAQHFAECRHCRAKFEALHPGLLGAAAAVMAIPAFATARRKQRRRARTP